MEKILFKKHFPSFNLWKKMSHKNNQPTTCCATDVSSAVLVRRAA
jgi:hypothetical protein